jgi:hypothetical protein
MESWSAFAGEGLICVAEDRITMIQGFTSPGSTIDMLIEFRESRFQISLGDKPNLFFLMPTLNCWT